MRKMKRKKKKQNLTGKVCVFLVVCVMTVIMTGQIVHLNGVNNEYKKEEKVKQEQLQAEKDRAEELKQKEAYVGSDQYIIDTAKAKLGMTYPDEIVFKEK